MSGMFGNPQSRDSIRRLQKEIEGMELKKQSLISAVQNEIAAITQQVNNELHQAGLKAYQGYMDKTDASGSMISHFDTVTQLNKVIEEKQNKIYDIAARYDDEIGLMRSQLNGPAAPVMPPVMGSGASCPGCGRAYTPGADKFCMSCGQSLPGGAPQMQAPAGNNTVAVCTKCGRAYTQGIDKFCDICGNALS